MDTKATEAIVKWADKQTTPAHTPKYKRLTDDQRIAILQLDKTGKSQVEIAQVIGCDQGTVSRWLSQCQDSTAQASTYLRGSALRMARNVVSRGQARDHIQALKGIGVLEADDRSIQIQVGVALPGMTFASNPSTVSTVIHKVSDVSGSDNSELC